MPGTVAPEGARRPAVIVSASSAGIVPADRALAALKGALQRPGLLSPEAFPNGRIVGDDDLQARARAASQVFAQLGRDPTPLVDFLQAHPWNRRLGRYFETLLQYYFLHVVRAAHVEFNQQIQEGKRTIGELDLVFRELEGGVVEHWEASVKFYLCVAGTPDEARETRFFLGTLVEDRLDRKLTKLVGKQLDLAQTAIAQKRLEDLRLAHPVSRALLKGFLYYPAWTNWQRHPHPLEISENHDRGWWTTEDRLDAIPRGPDSHFVFLTLENWIEPLATELEPHEIFTYSEFCARIHRDFDSSWARPLNHEAMVAEVEVVTDTTVRERSRGNVLHPKWPAHARESIFSSGEG